MIILAFLLIFSFASQVHAACTVEDNLGLFLFSKTECKDKEMGALLSQFPSELMDISPTDKTITHIQLTICDYSCGIKPDGGMKSASFEDLMKLVEFNESQWHAIKESVQDATHFCYQEMVKRKIGVKPEVVFSGVQCEDQKIDLADKSDFLTAKNVLKQDQKILAEEKADLEALTPSLLRAEYVTSILEDLKDEDYDLN